MRFRSLRSYRSRGSMPGRVAAHALLVLALLVAQIGAFTHALTHPFAHAGAAHAGAAHAQSALADLPDADPAERPGGTQSDGFCTLCSGYAGTAAVLLQSTVHGTAVPDVWPTPERRAQLLSTSPLLPFSSRAPPLVA